MVHKSIKRPAKLPNSIGLMHCMNRKAKRADIVDKMKRIIRRVLPPWRATIPKNMETANKPGACSVIVWIFEGQTGSSPRLNAQLTMSDMAESRTCRDLEGYFVSQDVLLRDRPSRDRLLSPMSSPDVCSLLPSVSTI